MTHALVALGAGNMGQAILAGLRAADPARPLYAADPSPEARARAHALGVHLYESPAAVIEGIPGGATLLLAVKPQQWSEIAPHLAGISPHVRVVSILAGVRIATIEAACPPGTPVVRAMPNTPALVRSGVTALAPGGSAREEDLDEVERIFSAVGRVVRVQEHDLDAVTAISGSGPAYFFLLAEILEGSAREMGLAPEVARTLATETARGAGRMLVESGEDAGTLRARVTSPGGTTHAALEEFARRGFSGAVHGGVEAARRRSEEMGTPPGKVR